MQFGFLTTHGKNALAGYVLHGLIDDAMKPYTPKDAPLWFVVLAVAVFLSVCYLFLRYFEKHELFLKL